MAFTPTVSLDVALKQLEAALPSAGGLRLALQCLQLPVMYTLLPAAASRSACAHGVLCVGTSITGVTLSAGFEVSMTAAVRQLPILLLAAVICSDCARISTCIGWF